MFQAAALQKHSRPKPNCACLLGLNKTFQHSTVRWEVLVYLVMLFQQHTSLNSMTVKEELKRIWK